MKAVITIGISASGKSTIARKEYPNYEVIERDAIRREILTEKGHDTNVVNMWSLWKFNKDNEDAVSRRYDIRLAACAAAKKNIVCADTNLNVKHLGALVTKLEKFGYEVEMRKFPIDYIEACRRDEKRRDTVGREIIYKQYIRSLEMFGRKKYVPDTSKPQCVLVDIDGTLAHMNGKRGPFEWDKVDVDDVDVHVRDMVNMLSKNGIIPIVFSGRDGVSRGLTEKWLDDNHVDHDYLFMRTEGDMRKDSIVKEEMFWKHIAGKYNCLYVIDDRPQVCRMWRELGIKVFQVGDPHDEF